MNIGIIIAGKGIETKNNKQTIKDITRVLSNYNIKCAIFNINKKINIKLLKKQNLFLNNRLKFGLLANSPLFIEHIKNNKKLTAFIQRSKAGVVEIFGGRSKNIIFPFSENDFKKSSALIL